MNAYLIISLICFFLTVVFIIGSIKDNKTEPYMDQIGPWGSWISLTVAASCLFAGVVYYIFSNYVAATIIGGIIAALIAPLWFNKRTAMAEPNEVWTFKDEFFAPKLPSGVRDRLVAKGGRRLVWLIWNQKDEVIPLVSYSTPEMDIELEPAKVTQSTSGTGVAIQNNPGATQNSPKLEETEPTLEAKVSLTWIIEDVRPFLRSAPKGKAVEFVTNRLSLSNLERVQGFVNGNFTAQDLRNDPSTIMSRMILAGPLAEESTYGVKVVKVTMSKVDWPKIVRDANNANARGDNILKAAIRSAGCKDIDEWNQLPNDERQDWYRRAQQNAGVENVSEEYHNVKISGGGAGAEQIAAGVLNRGKNPRKVK